MGKPPRGRWYKRVERVDVINLSRIGLVRTYVCRYVCKYTGLVLLLYSKSTYRKIKFVAQSVTALDIIVTHVDRKRNRHS